MSQSSLRSPMAAVSSRMRAYFAPVDRSAEAAAIFDPAKHGTFNLDAPPSPWIDLGWIGNFERTCATTIEIAAAGSPAVPVLQHRGSLGGRVEFDFFEWGKLQMALAGGAQHFNVLEADANSDAQPSGGTPLAAVALLPGSTASELLVGTGAINSFAIGDLVAVDVDYQQQIGYVGTGVSAAYVRDPQDVLRDVNYIRRVTFNVGRVAGETATSVLLAQPLLGGTPAPDAALQKVVAFVDREGGSFFQEWSALFIHQEQSGGRICFYYPRLSPSAPQASDKNGYHRENRVAISSPLSATVLHASFLALPYTDRNDSETVLCYRVYFPTPGAAIY
jgi:hypothetical protein